MSPGGDAGERASPRGMAGGVSALFSRCSSPACPNYPGGPEGCADCGLYRYSLERELTRPLLAGPDRGLIVWIALNPSTATATVNDPTIRREIDYSQRWGFSRLRKLNIFAFRSTDPNALRAAADPIGPDNDGHLVAGTEGAGLILCAWGTKSDDDAVLREMKRPAKVLALLHRAGRELHALKLTAGGHPSHPLYLPASLTPIPFAIARTA